MHNPSEKDLQHKLEIQEHQKRLHQQQFYNLIQQSCIPKRYINKSTSDFIIKETNTQAVYALNNPAYSYYIFGDCGSGKSFLASLITKQVIQSTLQSGLFLTATNIIYTLNPYKSTKQLKEDEEYQVPRHSIYNCGVLVIDDLGVENSSNLNQSILFDLINHRYNEDLQTIFTSNFNIIDLQKRLKSYEGGRIGRRITEMCKPISLQKFSK